MRIAKHQVFIALADTGGTQLFVRLAGLVVVVLNGSRRQTARSMRHRQAEGRLADRTIRREVSNGPTPVARSGLVILAAKPLADVFAALDAAELAADFLDEADRDRRPAQDRPALDQLLAEESSEDRMRR